MLKDCLKLSKLPRAVKGAIKAKAQGLFAEGVLDQREAERQAVAYFHDAAVASRDAIVKALNAPVQKPKGETQNAKQPSNAQVETRETALGRPGRPGGEGPGPGRGDHVVGETKGAGARREVPGAKEKKAKEEVEPVGRTGELPGVVDLAQSVKSDLGKQLNMPKGATAIRAVTTAGRVSIVPVRDFKGVNVLQGAGPFRKIEAGTTGRNKEFLPIKQQITAKEPQKAGEQNAKQVSAGKPTEGTGEPVEPGGVQQARREPEKAYRFSGEESVRAAFHDELIPNEKLLEGIGVRTRQVRPGEAGKIGLAYDFGNREIIYDPTTFLSIANNTGHAGNFLKSAVVEELVHAADHRTGGAFIPNGSVMLKAASDALQKLVRDNYGDGHEDESLLGPEYVRMLTMVRNGIALPESFYRDTSELERELAKPQSDAAEAAVSRISRALGLAAGETPAKTEETPLAEGGKPGIVGAGAPPPRKPPTAKGASQPEEEPEPSPEKKTTEAIRAAAKGPTRSPSAAVKEAVKTAGAAARTPLERVISVARATGNALADFFTKLPDTGDYKRLKGEWLGVGKLGEKGSTGRQKADFEALMMKKEIVRKFTPDSQDAINVWREAGGDEAVLRDQLAKLQSTKKTAVYAPIWERALKLSPEELAMAKKAGDFFEQKAKDGLDAGILNEVVENYVTHYWDRASMSAGDKAQATNRALGQYVISRLKTRFDNAYHRTLGSNFDGIMAGYKPATLRIGDVMSAYAQSFNHVVSDRVFVKSLATKAGGVASDGRPLGVVSGYAKPLGADEKPPESVLIMPHAKPVDSSDYRSIDHPAMRQHKWAGKDTDDNPIFLQGEVLVHPEIYQDLKNTLSRSALADTPVIKQVTTIQSEIKRTLLSFSGFHFTQLGTHAVGHRINPLNPGKIDWNDPLTQELVNNGLMLAPDYNARAEFMEGLSGSGLIDKIPFIGPIQEMISSVLFDEYHPRLKNAMARDAFERNLQRFKKELESGKITREQVAQKTAKQSNDAFGGQNYRYMGSNPTVTHMARMTFLAWDFLRSRSNFFADAFTKYGGEQRMALLLLGITMFVAAKMIERMLTGENHWDKPFSVVTGGREYEMRSVPGDALELWKDPRRFMFGRLSPLISKTTAEYLTGKDYRGAPRSLWEQIQDLVKTPIPIPIRSFFERTDLTPLQGLAASFAFRAKRYSPISEVKKLGIDWQQKQGIEGAGEVFPPSKYLAVRQALEDGDVKKAQTAFAEVAKKDGTEKALKGFRASMMRPFSGSAKNEAAFVASLSPGDKKLYNKAQALRSSLMDTFQSVVAPQVAAVATRGTNPAALGIARPNPRTAALQRSGKTLYTGF